MEVKEEIKGIIKKALIEKWPDLELEENEIELNYPVPEFGDYATNVALKISSKLQKNPIEVAEELSRTIEEKNSDIFEKASFAKPGFINFSLSKKYFNQSIKNILKIGDEWGKIKDLEGEKYIFEHSSPNLFKPFHVGHLVNNSIGESLVRIIRNSGVENLITLSFPSDISPGIAKTVWAIKKKNWEENELTIEKIGEAYVFGTKEYKENKQAKKEIDLVNEILYLKKPSEELKIYEKGQKLSLDYFKKITKRLGSEFDELIFESESELAGKEIVKKNVPGVFRKSEGAIIFPGSEHGLFDNVFINSQGFGTYLAKDIGLLKIKFDKFNFDKSVTITDVEQKDHFRLIKKAAELLNNEWSDKSEYVQHGRLTFSGAKISSRLGNVPLAEDLIDLVKNRLIEKIEKQDFSEKEKDEIAEKVAISALKYSILKSNAGRNINFDMEKATSFEGNTGPYLQYALVRTNSILNKAEKLGIKDDFDFTERKIEVPLVEKMLLRFPESVSDALKDNSPHHIANYLYELASEFGSFYSQTRVLDEKNPDFKNNLALVKAIQVTLRNGLYLLGIETLERM